MNPIYQFTINQANNDSVFEESDDWKKPVIIISTVFMAAIPFLICFTKIGLRLIRFSELSQIRQSNQPVTVIFDKTTGINFCHHDNKVISLIKSGNTWDEFPGSLYEAIFSLMQESQYFSIHRLLNSQDKKKGFLGFLLKCDESGSLRLFANIHLPYLKKILKLAEESGQLRLLLTTSDKTSGETLLTKVALRGSRSTLGYILSQIDILQIDLSTNEQCIRAAFEDNEKFSEIKLKKLDQSWKQKVYQVANTYFSERFFRMRRHLLYSKIFPVQEHTSINLVNYTMDVIEVSERLKYFFNTLQYNGQIVDLIPEGYTHISDDLEQWIGASYVKKSIQDMELTEVEVPRHLICHQREHPEVRFTISPDQSINTLGVSVFQEEITISQRELTNMEKEQRNKLIQSTHLKKSSFYIGKNKKGEEKLYVLNTAYSDFQQPFSIDKNHKMFYLHGFHRRRTLLVSLS